MDCCNRRAAPNSDVPFSHMGCACETWAHMKDMFTYLKDERNHVVPCKPSQFSVNWSSVDPMTFLFVVTDNITGETIDYSVMRESTRESPEQAFERDWREKEVRHNRGVQYSLFDQLEAIEENDPDRQYKLSRTDTGFVIHRRIARDLGIVVFKIEYDIERSPNGLPWMEPEAHQPPDIDVEVPTLAGDVSRALETLLKRFRKIGVVFNAYETEKVKDFTKVTIQGWAKRNDASNILIKVVYQNMEMDDPSLNQYHEYYTDRGKQDGLYIC